MGKSEPYTENYYEIEFFAANKIAINATLVLYVNDYFLNSEGSIHKTGAYNVIMSSVPYDITETAI